MKPIDHFTEQLPLTRIASAHIAATEPNRKILEIAAAFALREFSFTRVWILLNKTTGVLSPAQCSNLEGTEWEIEPAKGKEVFLDIFKPIGPAAYESPEALLKAVLGAENHARIFETRD